MKLVKKMELSARAFRLLNMDMSLYILYRIVVIIIVVHMLNVAIAIIIIIIIMIIYRRLKF